MEQQNTQPTGPMPASRPQRSSNYSRTRRPEGRTHTRTAGTAGTTSGGRTHTQSPRNTPRTRPSTANRDGGAMRSERTNTRRADGATRAPRRPRIQKNFSRVSPALTHRPTVRDPKVVQIMPVTDPDIVRIIPLGGVEEIGMNMTVVEIGDDIIVIDAGFKFKDSDTPGVDYILPNTKYLEERKHKIKAMIVTHGHLDHIGALPFIMDRIGNPPIYAIPPRRH